MSNSLRTLLQKAMEPTEPRDTILAYWKAHEGETWTSRHEEPLRAAIERARPDLKGTVQFRTTLGSHREVGWGRGEEVGVARIYICHYDWARKALNRTIDPEFLVSDNPAAFKGADERNELRRKALLDYQLMHKAEALLKQHNNIRGTLAHIEAELHMLMQHGEPLSADSYEIQYQLMGVKRGEGR
jgi:hypothetical protein